MPSVMAKEKRLRVSFDAKNEIIRRAVYIAAAMKGKSHNDVLNDLIEEHLANFIELAKKAIDEEDPVPKRKKPDVKS
jgi:hypothetical protein